MVTKTKTGGAGIGKAASKACFERALHVDHNETSSLWDVIDEDGQIIGHARDRVDAIDLAIREAQHSHSRGDDVVVCVQQVDGHYTLAWSPV